MEPQSSLPYSQAPATCPYAEPTPSSPYPHILLPEYPSLRLGLPSCLFPSGFPTKTLYSPVHSPIRSTCTPHLIILYFITRTILGENLLMSYHSISTGAWFSVWTSRNIIRFYCEQLLAPRPNPNLEDHPSSAVRECLFNIFAAALHTAGRSSIRNLRTRHAVVTGTLLSRTLTMHNLTHTVRLFDCQCPTFVVSKEIPFNSSFLALGGLLFVLGCRPLSAANRVSDPNFSVSNLSYISLKVPWTEAESEIHDRCLRTASN
jgi:hypothetical protein